SPKLRSRQNKDRLKGGVEMLRKANAQELGQTDINIGIAGKIEINLKQEQHGAKPSKIRAVRRDVKNIIDDRSEAVRQHHLFYKTQDDKTEAEDQQAMPPRLVVEDSLYLRKRLIGPNDWSGNQLRKKRFEQEEFGERACRPVATAYDVDVIGQSLKTIERDAERECDVNEAAGRAGFPEQHVAVFEVPDEPEGD